MNNIKLIEDNETYKQILKDSFGGVMYNVANQGKYDTKELLELYESLTPQEKEAFNNNGISKGVIHFARGN